MKKKRRFLRWMAVLTSELAALAIISVHMLVPVGEDEMYVKAKADERMVSVTLKKAETVNRSLPNKVSSEILKESGAKAQEAYQKEQEEIRAQQKQQDQKAKELKKQYDGKLIAFTFDDGPGIYTEKLLEGLKERNAHATFMLLGSCANQRPDVVQRMIQEGHQIGNHSWSHPVLSGLSQEEIHSELSSTRELIESLGYTGTCVVRPPYGDYNDTVLQEADAPIVLWNVDTEDWKHKGDADTVYNNIMRDAQDGAVILMHDIYESSVDAALRAMDTLKEQGYQFVTVEEMLSIRDIPMEKGKRYYSASEGR